MVTSGQPLKLLCLGAHSDDIEIGFGGTLLEWIEAGVRLDVTWCVLSAVGERASEAEASARDFLKGCERADIRLGQFKDGYFPYEGERVKRWIEDIRLSVKPDLVLTHRRDDAHQDHREVCKLTWNAFRDHVILEYEIPKWDGDLGRPNAYMPLKARTLDRKIELLNEHFGTQRSKDWFDRQTFEGLARLRGMECRAPERFAEGFTIRKILIHTYAGGEWYNGAR
jgi:LmbE family N-acetylglucosaminyl deacetylase